MKVIVAAFNCTISPINGLQHSTPLQYWLYLDNISPSLLPAAAPRPAAGPALPPACRHRPRGARHRQGELSLVHTTRSSSLIGRGVHGARGHPGLAAGHPHAHRLHRPLPLQLDLPGRQLRDRAVRALLLLSAAVPRSGVTQQLIYIAKLDKFDM